MIVYMVHKDHGTHICYSQPEVDKCKAGGWVERDKPQRDTLHLPKKPGRQKKDK